MIHEITTPRQQAHDAKNAAKRAQREFTAAGEEVPPEIQHILDTSEEVLAKRWERATAIPSMEEVSRTLADDAKRYHRLCLRLLELRRDLTELGYGDIAREIQRVQQAIESEEH